MTIFCLTFEKQNDSQMKKIISLIILLCSFFPVHAQHTADSKLAAQYLYSGEFEKAVVIYEDLYKKNKSSFYYESYLKCLIGLKDYETAEKLIKKQQKKYRNQAALYVDQGYIYQLKGDQEKADKYYQKAIDGLSDNPISVSNVARAFNAKQLLSYSLEAYQYARKHINDGDRYSYQIAQIHSSLGNTEEMYAEYMNMLVYAPNYLNTIKNAISITIDKDSEHENNQTLRKLLLKRVQENNSELFSDLLIWLYVQEKNFSGAFIQEKALDKRLGGDQSGIVRLAKLSVSNKDYKTALQCYEYITSVENSPYHFEAKSESLETRKMLIVDGESTESPEELSLAYLSFFEEYPESGETIKIMRSYAELQAFYNFKREEAKEILERAIAIRSASRFEIAQCKLTYADILLADNNIWEAIIYYSQVEKDFKSDELGHEAKFRRARISYYQGDFEWAQAQLSVLKKSTSKRIANNAMDLSLLIGDHLNLDTTAAPMAAFSRADLLIYQNNKERAMAALDSILVVYPIHSLVPVVYYRKAKLFLSNKDYNNALLWLEKLYTDYNYELLADDALFLAATINESYLRDKEKAAELYQSIMLNHPSSTFAIRARKRFRKLRGDQVP